MSHFFQAVETATDYRFQVCDAGPGQCPHATAEAKAEQHRSYIWVHQGANQVMAVADMVREVRLLEAERLAKLTLPTTTPLLLSPEGTPVEGVVL
jgi:hypothetical protein